MEDPLGQAFSNVIRPLLNGSAEDSKRVIETYFTQNCCVHHPLFRQVGEENSRAKVIEIFSGRAGTFQCSEISNTGIAFDDSNNKLFCTVTRTLSVKHVPLTTAQVRSVIVLDLVIQNEQFYKVRRWEEFIQPDDLTALLPVPGARMATNGVRNAAAYATLLPSRFMSVLGNGFRANPWG